ncbi:hypothetical protein ACLEPN_01120 [Myxococcus sp. 1LA]
MDRSDLMPDVRDGLTRVERIILHTLHQLQQERGGRSVPTVMLYGYVVEHVNLSPHEFQRILARLVGRARQEG